VFQKWVELLAIVTLFAIPGLKQEKLNGKLMWLVLAFLAWSWLSAALGVNYFKSITGNFYRNDGLITLIHLVLLFFILTLLITKKLVKKLLFAFCFPAILLSLWVITEAFLYFGFGYKSVNIWEDSGFGAAFGNPNFLAGYLLVTLPITYYQSFKSDEKTQKLWVVGIIAQVVGIYLTRAWSAYFGVLGLVAIVFLTQFKSKKKIVVSLFSLLFLTLTLFFVRDFSQNYIPNRITAESRERIFVKGLLALKERPITGWGWANFDIAFDSIDWPIKFDKDAYVDKAHASILEVAVTTGTVGLFLYLSIIYITTVTLMKQKGRLYKMLALVFVLTVIHMQTNVVSISEEMVFWSLAAVSTKLNNNLRKH